MNTVGLEDDEAPEDGSGVGFKTIGTAIGEWFRQELSHKNDRDYKIIYRNKLNHVIRIAKKNYYSKRLDQAGTDIKSTWNTINELISY